MSRSMLLRALERNWWWRLKARLKGINVRKFKIGGTDC